MKDILNNVNQPNSAPKSRLCKVFKNIIQKRFKNYYMRNIYILHYFFKEFGGCTDAKYYKMIDRKSTKF